MGSEELAEVSVIIPCYCCVGTIGRAVASIVKQTIRPREVILIDDCSNDGTLNELYRLQAIHSDDLIKVIPLTTNVGPGMARNAGWEVATQPFIAFLDSDDSWHPQKIKIQYGWMMAHPNVVLTGHDCLQLSKDDLFLPEGVFDVHSVTTHEVSKINLLWSNRYSTPSVMLRRDIAERFAKEKYHSEDYLLWLEIICGGKSAYKIELPLAYFYKAAYGEGGLSAQLWKMQKGQLDTYQRIREMEYVSTFYYQLLRVWSLTRFLRRLFLSRFRR